jgi:hypothetical protein
MRRAGTIMIIVGGLVFLAAITFLDYGLNRTLWDLTTREPAVLTVIGATAVALAATTLLSARPIIPLLATCCSFYLFGQIFPDGARAYHGARAGFWLATSATVAMSMGGDLVIVGSASSARRFTGPS